MVRICGVDSNIGLPVIACLIAAQGRNDVNELNLLGSCQPLWLSLLVVLLPKLTCSETGKCFVNRRAFLLAAKKIS